MTIYIPPTFETPAFNCPACGAYAQQIWQTLVATPYKGSMSPSQLQEPKLAFCWRCQMNSIWVDGKLVYPDVPTAPLPNPDLSADIKRDYTEASQILNRSPRGAAALLRLVIQKVCIQLGYPGKDTNSDIGALVKAGLPVTIQQALDSVRVIGNEAVHPGQMDLRDDIDTAAALFKLVNLIAQRMITEPRETQKLFENLPPAKRDAIQRRDT